MFAADPTASGSAPAQQGGDARLCLAWLAAGVVAASLALVVVYVVPWFVAPPDPLLAGRLLLPSVVKAARPEPLEQARYVAALVTGFLLLCAAAAAWARLPAPAGAQRPRWLYGSALVLQAALVSEWAAAWWSQSFSPFAYHPLARVFLAAAVAVPVTAMAVVVARREGRDPRTAQSAAPSRAPAAIATLLVVLGALPAVFSDGNLAHAYFSIRFHLPYSVGEFAPVVAGRTPLVDFHPQYVNVLSLLLAPLFALTGTDTLPFTLTMAALSVAGLLLLRSAFWRAAANPWLALAVFAPVLAMIFFGAVGSDGPGHGRFIEFERQYLLSHHPAAPLRLLGPWATAWLLSRQLQAPSRARLAALLFVAALTLVNNLDLGVPALGAAALALVAAAQPDRRGRAALRIAGAALLAVCAAVALFVLVALVRSGELPDVRRALDYQRAFVALGFLMLPMPPQGVHWPVFLTWAAALAAGLFGLARGAPQGPARVRRGLLVFAGVFGFGAGMYFVGRSHPWSLSGQFHAWGFALGLLALEIFDDLRRARGAGALALRLAPAFLVVFQLVLFAGDLPEQLNPVAQTARFALDEPGAEAPIEGQLVEAVRARAAPGERVVLAYPYAHRLALRAGVDNVYPFAHQGSLILQSQAQRVLEVVRERRVNRVFGALPPLMQDLLRQEGFFRAGTLVQDDPTMRQLGYGPFEYWERGRLLPDAQPAAGTDPG